MYFLSRFDWLTVMWTQVLLQIQKRDLGFSWWFEQITQLIVQYQNATVVWMLQPLVVDVLVNGARDGTSRDQFTFWQFQKHTKFFGDDLLAVKPVVFGALSRLFPVWVVLFRLNLSDDFRERFDIVSDSGDFIYYLCHQSLSLFFER